MMRNRKTAWAVGAALLIITAAAAGCQATVPSAAPEQSPAQIGNVTEHSPPSSSSPTAMPTATPAAIQSASTSEKQASNTSEVQPASADDKPKAAAPKEASKKKAFEPYSSAKPLLMGIALGDARTKAAALHGNPVQEFVMEDEVDPITVLEYDGFSIGFNGKKLVEFVEITSKDTDPGLNGLRLGQTVDDAAKALGNPDVNTEFVVSYKTKATILKLDVDPKSKTIQSIKLFARNE